MSAGIRAALLAGLSALTACPPEPQAPGDTLIGTFDLAIEGRDGGSDCPFDASLPPQVAAILSIDSKTGRVYMTIGRASHEGLLVGHELTLSSSARRNLPAPCDCSCRIAERIEARVYGERQAKELGGCADAGEPMETDAGLDIGLICGTIRDELTDFGGDACACGPCAAEHSFSGTRQ